MGHLLVGAFEKGRTGSFICKNTSPPGAFGFPENDHQVVEGKEYAMEVVRVLKSGTRIMRILGPGQQLQQFKNTVFTDIAKKGICTPTDSWQMGPMTCAITKYGSHASISTIWELELTFRWGSASEVVAMKDVKKGGSLLERYCQHKALDEEREQKQQEHLERVQAEAHQKVLESRQPFPWLTLGKDTGKNRNEVVGIEQIIHVKRDGTIPLCMAERRSLDAKWMQCEEGLVHRPDDFYDGDDDDLPVSCIHKECTKIAVMYEASMYGDDDYHWVIRLYVIED